MVRLTVGQNSSLDLPPPTSPQDPPPPPPPLFLVVIRTAIFVVDIGTYALALDTGLVALACLGLFFCSLPLSFLFRFFCLVFACLLPTCCRLACKSWCARYPSSYCVRHGVRPVVRIYLHTSQLEGLLPTPQREPPPRVSSHLSAGHVTIRIELLIPSGSCLVL